MLRKIARLAVRELCKVVDLLIVVGASYSSNSKRLCEIGREIGIASYLVADGSEVDPNWLKGVSTVGLTAGASAPEQLVQSVITALRTLDEVEVSHMTGIKEHVEFRLPAALRPAPQTATTASALSTLTPSVADGGV